MTAPGKPQARYRPTKVGHDGRSAVMTGVEAALGISKHLFGKLKFWIPLGGRKSSLEDQPRRSHECTSPEDTVAIHI
jgi:hypothetical protein